MNCPKCNADVTGAVRFCRSCGAALQGAPPEAQATACPACGASVRPGAKFCGACAAPLVAVPAPVVHSAGTVCTNCGAELKEGARFCKSCGKAAGSVGSGEAVVAAKVPVPVPSAPAQPAPDVRSIAASEAPTLVDPAPPLRPVVPPTPVGPKPRPAAALPPQVPTSKSGGNRDALVSIIALLVVVALGATYWFVLRKPKVHESATPEAAVQAPAAAQPPVESSSSSGPEGQTGSESPAATSGSSEQPPATPAAPAAGAPASAKAAKPAPGKSLHPGYAQAHDQAQQALQASHYLEPPDGSALFWERKAKALGDPGAAQIEQQIFAGEMSQISTARQNHNYDQAQAHVYQLASNFPEQAELRQLQDDIAKEQQGYTKQVEEQRRQAELATRIKKIAVQHRHGVGSNFCTGIITVTPDGTAKYDCTTADNGGRCEHVTFAPGSLKEAKLRGDGSLHVATRQAGNFDFVGGDMNLKDALAALTPLVGH